jgi:hypothetical protein
VPAPFSGSQDETAERGPEFENQSLGVRTWSRCNISSAPVITRLARICQDASRNTTEVGPEINLRLHPGRDRRQVKTGPQQCESGSGRIGALTRSTRANAESQNLAGIDHERDDRHGVGDAMHSSWAGSTQGAPAGTAMLRLERRRQIE